MPLDFRTALDQAIWSAIEADSALSTGSTPYFKVGNRLKEKTDGWLKAIFKRLPNDFPNLAINMRGEPTPPAPPRTFGMGTSYTPSVVDFALPLTQQVELVLTAQLDTDTLPIEAALDRVIMSKWPAFGLSYVTGFTTSTTRKESQVNGVRCTQVTKLLTVSLRPKMSQLVA